MTTTQPLEIEPLVGVLHPLAVRDAALDYIYRRQGENSKAHLFHLPDVNNILMTPGDDVFFSAHVTSEDTTASTIFFERLLLTRRTMPVVAHYFYGRMKGNEILEDISKKMYEAYNTHNTLMFFQVMAWLTIDDWRWHHRVLYTPPGFTYGLVGFYPNVVLHAAQCIFNLKPGYYEDMVPQRELQEVKTQARELAYNGLTE